MKKRIYILTVLLFWAGLLVAQNPSFTASVSSTNVAVGEQFQVEFTLNTNGDRFTPPSFSGFQVLSGPNVSTSMTSINGSTTMTNSYSYILAAEKEGTFSIGPASIRANGQNLSTRNLQITVKGFGRSQGGRNRAQQQQAQDQDDVPQESPAELAKALFIKAVVNKTNIYQGEQINVSYRIYTRIGILQSQLDKLPDLNGFWSQDVGDPRQAPQWHTEIINGTKFNVAELKQTVLFPERSGNLTIDPMAMTIIAREPAPARDVMEQFFGGAFKDIKVKVKSPAVIIHVKPLPEAGKPADFGGAVGTFSMEANVDKNALKANEALNLNVKITGAGNIKLIKNITPAFPPDFEKYDPKVTDTINKAAAKVEGSRLYNYLLIPRHEGKYTIDPVKFTYFNPATEKYVTLSSKPFPITVAKGDKQASVTTLSSADKQDVKILEKDIRYIKMNDDGLNQAGESFFGSALYYLLLLLGPGVFIAAYFYRKWYLKQNSDIVKVKSRKASKMAAKHLKDAKKLLAAKNSNDFHEVVFKGIYGYLGDKLNIPYANLDKDVIAEALRKRSVKENTITQLQDVLDLCDMARFAPVKGISDEEVYEKAKNVINDIEDEI